MNLNDIKDLMAQFDQSSLREFSYKNGTDELQFSKNEARLVSEVASQAAPTPVLATPSPVAPTSAPAETVAEETSTPAEASVAAEGDVVESHLLGWLTWLLVQINLPSSQLVIVSKKAKHW